MEVSRKTRAAPVVPTPRSRRRAIAPRAAHRPARRTPSRAAPARLERAHAPGTGPRPPLARPRTRRRASSRRSWKSRRPRDLARARPRQKTNRQRPCTASAACVPLRYAARARSPRPARPRTSVALAPGTARGAGRGNPREGRRDRSWSTRAGGVAVAPSPTSRRAFLRLPAPRGRARGVANASGASRRRVDATPASPRGRDRGRERSPRRARARRAAPRSRRGTGEERGLVPRAARLRAFAAKCFARFSRESSRASPPSPSLSFPPSQIRRRPSPPRVVTHDDPFHLVFDPSQGDNSKFYDALGVAKNADAAEIKKAYRKLVRAVAFDNALGLRSALAHIHNRIVLLQAIKYHPVCHVASPIAALVFRA